MARAWRCAQANLSVDASLTAVAVSSCPDGFHTARAGILLDGLSSLRVSCTAGTACRSYHVYRTVLRTLTIVGLVMSISTIASASPAISLLDHATTPRAGNIEPVDYNWNHHRYHHRSWNNTHHHWHYYD